MVKKHLFIGGWASTGSKLLVEILEKRGYNSFPEVSTVTKDFQGLDFVYAFIRFNSTSNFDELKKLITTSTYNENSKWVIKHGHLIKCIPELKKLYPDSIFICTARNPLDIFNKGSDPNYMIFGNNTCDNPPISGKLDTFMEWYNEGLKYADYIVRYEDILFNPKETIEKLYKFLELENTVTDDILSMINKTSTFVGSGKKVFSSEDEHVKKVLEYSKKFGYK
jgi:hypothetical protein